MLRSSFRRSASAGVFLLCAAVLAQNFLPTEFSAPFIVLLGILTAAFAKIPPSFIKIAWPLIWVLAIGLIGIAEHESRDILRDIAYGLWPLALMFIGYWIAGRPHTWPLIMKVIVILGLVVALHHLSAFAQDTDLLKADYLEVRTNVVGSGEIVVLAFFLVLFQSRYGIKDLFPRLAAHFLILPILFASFALTYSRTGFFIALIMFAALGGWATKGRYRLLLLTAAIFTAYFALSGFLPDDEGETFLGKIARSATEIAPSDYQFQSDITRNWRGFETNRAIDAYLSGNLLQLMLGQGFGSLVDLGFYMPLGFKDDVYDLRYIPILHNGYAYLLFKTGLFGFGFYVLFFVNLIRRTLRYSHSSNSEKLAASRLLLGCVLCLMPSMFVIGGMAQMHGLEFVFLLGYLSRKLELAPLERLPTRTREVASLTT